MGFKAIQKRRARRSNLKDPRLSLWATAQALVFRPVVEEPEVLWILFGMQSFLSPHRNTNPFMYDERLCYVSIAHGFLHQMALALDLHLLAAEILLYPNNCNIAQLKQESGYDAESNAWEKNQSIVMRTLITLFYNQNPFFKQQLLRTKNRKLIYCRDPGFPGWSCGLYARDKSKIKYVECWTDENLYGTLLGEVRDDFVKE